MLRLLRHLLCLLGPVAALCMAGCARTQVAWLLEGAAEAAWVYIDSDDAEHRGVYRCEVTSDGPVCLRAQLLK